WDPQHPERNLPAKRFVELAAHVERAIVGESARWGDQHGESPFTLDDSWKPVRDRVLRDFLPRRSGVLLDQLRAAGLYPNVAAPRFNQHGGEISSGFELSVIATEGRAYYTLDGSDPRAAGGGVSGSAVDAGLAVTGDFVVDGADARVLVPQNGNDGASWTGWAFDDSSWTAGRTGVGYEQSSGYEDFFRTDVEDELHDQNTSVYIRIPFDVESTAMSTLTLSMRYDDGFVAYINGQRVASRNAPETLAWNSAASQNASDSGAVVFQSIDISSSVSALRVGQNVLALHGLNVSAGSSDFLCSAELRGATSSEHSTILSESSLVKARALHNSEWSALHEAQFIVGGPSKLRVSEIMYNPPRPILGEIDADEFEFLELENTGTETIRFDGVRIEGGIDFDFADSAVTELGPGQLLVIVRNLERFRSRYPNDQIVVAGEYRNRLGNGGDLVRIVGPLGDVLEFDYEDVWHPATDGEGRALVAVDTSDDPSGASDAAYWRESLALLGSPGFPDSDSPFGRVLPGDANSDGEVDLSDPIRLLVVLFQGGVSLPCGDDPNAPGNIVVFDANGDGAGDVSDVVHLLAFLFQDGPEPSLGTECQVVEDCEERCLSF
ncbi:MAG: hypothetical protein AAF517_24045, partial [Planctomycetota bacterium]